MTHFLFRAEAERPAALNGGHAPGLWRQLLQRHDARLKLLRRASGWIESLSAVNSQLLCGDLWGELLPQLVFHSAQTQESTDGPRSWESPGHLGQSRPATRPRAHHPQKSSGETSNTIATEAATSVKAATVGAGSPTARRRSVATEARLHTPPARAHPKPSRRVRPMLWPATRILPARPGQLTAHLQRPDAESRPVPDAPSLAAYLHDGEQASSGERAASGVSPDGGDLQRTRLSACELPREAGRELLLRFQQPQPSSSVMTSAIYTHGSTHQDNSDVSSDDRPGKHRFQNREAVAVAAQSRPTALSYGQLRDEPRDDESDSPPPARPRRAARNVSTRKRARVKTVTHQIFETAATTSALSRMPDQTRHGQRREPPGREISANELRETWRGELAKRVSRLIGVTSSYAVAPVTLVAPIASAHMALTEQIAATLEGQTAPPDLLLALVGRSVLHSQARRENSQRRTQTSAYAGTASKANVQAFNPKRDAFLTPVRRSRQSPGSSGGLDFYDETPHEYQGGPVLERGLGSEEVSLIVKERSASPAAAVSEQHVTTFAAATVLPPLVPPRTSEANELAAAVAVARQGAYSESLTEAEDLDALAEKIKLILDEQARRHGIDV